MTTMNNEDPADPSVHEPRVTNAPAEIWLVYGDLEHDDTHANLYRDGDVTWCQHQIWASDVRYVRAEAIAAERERTRAKEPCGMTTRIEREHAAYLRCLGRPRCGA